MSVPVTDHALLRYIERVLGIDVAAQRSTIGEACARHQGAPCVKIEGARFLLRDGRVVTVLDGETVPHFRVLQKLQRPRSAHHAELARHVGGSLAPGGAAGRAPVARFPGDAIVDAECFDGQLGFAGQQLAAERLQRLAIDAEAAELRRDRQRAERFDDGVTISGACRAGDEKDGKDEDAHGGHISGAEA